MNECLITKLKSSVNDESLPIFNGFRFSFRIGETNKNGYVASAGLIAGNTEIEILDDDVFITRVAGNATFVNDKKVLLGDESIDYPGFFINKVSDGITTHKVNCILRGKYNLSQLPELYGLEYGLNDLRYCDDLSALRISTESNIGGNLFDFPSLKRLSTIEVYDTYSSKVFEGNIKDLLKKMDTGTLEYFRGVFSKVKIENIDVFSNFTKLKLLAACSLSNKIEGTIENFVSGQRSAGRTSCSNFTLSLENSSVTFNGSLVAEGSRVLSWTPSTIVLDGVTITA